MHMEMRKSNKVLCKSLLASAATAAAAAAVVVIDRPKTEKKVS